MERSLALDEIFRSILKRQLSFENLQCDNSARDLLLGLLAARPRDRCTAADALRHEWIAPLHEKTPLTARGTGLPMRGTGRRSPTITQAARRRRRPTPALQSRCDGHRRLLRQGLPAPFAKVAASGE